MPKTGDEAQHPPQSPMSASLKRGFDVALSSAALVAFAVPMAVVAFLIRLHDGGPALYRQVRIGRDCQPFSILKFRSMVIDADKIGSYSTEAGDPRITPIGRFIRRTSFDELPQLLNVLRGDMSIVGPRPDVPPQEKLYTPSQWRMRHLVRPGITGLAQATSRSTATPEARLELDLSYVQSASLSFDIKIILLTVCQLFAKSGN